MKLHNLFENKKEIKNRNPVAQELRANPQFKAKTEIDKKKEVKKGYQKHKGKVEEASGYQGQSEPTYHVFKNADIKKIVDIIKAKNLKAYPEKTADGVKVHTFDLDRSAVAKELGINETMDTEYKEVKAILDKHGITKADDIELGTPAYEELFGYYMDSGEMPYGVMKARTGMPDEWIVNRLDDLGLVEQVQEDDTTYVKMVIQKYPQEWQKFLQTGDLMDAPNIYEKLFVYFHFDRSEMPYGTAKARDGDPYVWIADKLADLGLAEDVNEADLNAWYAEQYAKELAEKDGKVWSRMSYGDKEDYRKIANKKYGVVKSEGADVPTQKGRDAKHDVLTPRAKNKVLQQIKHDANKERRANSKKAVADIEIENESIKKTDYDNMLNVANRNRDADLARIQKLAGIVPMQMQEDYAKMTHELIIKLIKAGKSDQEIQARTGETSKRIEIIRNNIKKETPEATQDLARSLNPFKSAVDTNMSPQLTAKGLDAITKGARPTPNEIKAVEPYVSKLAKAITNPTTAAQVRNVFKKVQ
jgi:hypothetical protein